MNGMIEEIVIPDVKIWDHHHKHSFISNSKFMRKLFLLTVMVFIGWSVQAQNVGVDQTNPMSKLDVNGGLSVGSSYSGTFAAPANGAIFEGNVGIGITNPNPNSKLEVIDTLDLIAEGVIVGKFEGRFSFI